MSELRQQLQAARNAYHDSRYFGDLASSVLEAPIRLHVVSRGWLVASISAGTIAAAASVAILLTTPASLGKMPSAQLMRSIRLPDLPANTLHLPRYLTVAPPIQHVIPQGVRDLFMGQGQQQTPLLDEQMSDPKDQA